ERRQSDPGFGAEPERHLGTYQDARPARSNGIAGRRRPLRAQLAVVAGDPDSGERRLRLGLEPLRPPAERLQTPAAAALALPRGPAAPQGRRASRRAPRW